MYFDYIKGKKVVFVGACPILKGKRQGEEIDSYDVVVRTNGSINLIDNPEFTKDFGRRCDVLYTNGQFYREMKPLPIGDYKCKGVKWLCMKGIEKKDKRDYSNLMNVRTIRDTINKVIILLESANMGSFIYTDILDQAPKELMVTGVDFFASKMKVFQTGNYQEYVDGYLPDKIVKQGNIINQGKTEDGHDFIGNAKYIHSLYEQFENFAFPEEILNILTGIIKGEVTQR